MTAHKKMDIYRLKSEFIEEGRPSDFSKNSFLTMVEDRKAKNKIGDQQQHKFAQNGNMEARKLEGLEKLRNKTHDFTSETHQKDSKNNNNPVSY